MIVGLRLGCVCGCGFVTLRRFGGDFVIVGRVFLVNLRVVMNDQVRSGTRGRGAEKDVSGARGAVGQGRDGWGGERGAEGEAQRQSKAAVHAFFVPERTPHHTPCYLGLCNVQRAPIRPATSPR